MKIRELIEQLKEYDPELDVLTLWDLFDYCDAKLELIEGWRYNDRLGKNAFMHLKNATEKDKEERFKDSPTKYLLVTI